MRLESTAVALTIVGADDGTPLGSVLITTLGSDTIGSLWCDSRMAIRNWKRYINFRISDYRDFGHSSRLPASYLRGTKLNYLWFHHSPCTWYKAASSRLTRWSVAPSSGCGSIAMLQRAPRTAIAPGSWCCWIWNLPIRDWGKWRWGCQQPEQERMVFQSHLDQQYITWGLNLQHSDRQESRWSEQEDGDIFIQFARRQLCVCVNIYHYLRPQKECRSKMMKLLRETYRKQKYEWILK